MNKGMTMQAITHRKFTLFMILAFLIAGAYAYFMLPRQETADLSPPIAQIFAMYPGSSAMEMEQYVTNIIEDELRNVQGYDSTKSTTKAGLASIVLHLKDDADTDAAWDDLDEVIVKLKQMMPAGVTAIESRTNIVETPGIVIAMTGNAHSNEELADYADQIKDRLSLINGMDHFEVYGEMEKVVEVKVDHGLLMQVGVSLGDVAAAIGADNVSMPSGALDNGVSKVEVSVDSRYNRIEEIGETRIKTLSDGREIRVKDVAGITYAADSNGPRFKQDGQDAVFLAGFFQEDLNIVQVGKQVEAEIEQIRTFLPKDITFSLMTYQPHDVEKSLNDFIINLVQAIVLVIGVVFFSMGVRNAAVVSTVIPLSIAITFGAMVLMGVKLEQMSISGLIIALGMLVDNAIVVSDAIQHHIDEGMDNFKAAIQGTREVAFSILTSTLTTVFAFSPLLLLDSTLGKFVYGVPFVVSVALIASYFCAMITTPLIAALLFRPTKAPSKVKVNRIRAGFSKLLTLSLARKKRTVALAILFVLASGFLIVRLESSLLPKADKDLIQIDLVSEFAADMDKTEALAEQVVGILGNEPELTGYYQSVGSNLPKFYLSVQYRSPSRDIAQLAYRFDLKAGNRFKTKEELQSYIQKKIDGELVGGTASTMLLELGSFSKPIEIILSHPDLERLEAVSEDLIVRMQETEGLFNRIDDFSNREYQFHVDIDENKAGFYGYTKLDIQKEITSALMGTQASTFKRNGEESPIRISSTITTKEELENLPVLSARTKTRMLLKDLAQVGMVSQYPVINHQDGIRSVMISADIEPGISVKAVESSLKEFAAAGDYQDVAFNFDGQLARIKESNMDLGRLGLFALLMILAVLILQFNSIGQPLIIMGVIPVAFASALLGLAVTGQVLSFVATLSLVALMGIVVNNAIVLIDCINSLRAEGLSTEAAAVAAVERRYRPITLSTTTTVIGLFPLLISGGELFRPLAITLIFGLSFSTVITMVVIPTLYCLIYGSREATPQDSEA